MRGGGESRAEEWERSDKSAVTPASLLIFLRL